MCLLWNMPIKVNIDMRNKLVGRITNHLKNYGYGILGGLIVILIIVLVGVHVKYHYDRVSWQNAKIIIITKQDFRLRVIDYKGNELLNVPCAIGKIPGNKKDKGDMKTPEGIFYLRDKQDSHAWKHNFNDGNGMIEGAYGPKFLRLDVPGQKGIGIHGTHIPESVGTRATEGCIRLENENIERLYDLVSIPCVVIIVPGDEDVIINQKDMK